MTVHLNLSLSDETRCHVEQVPDNLLAKVDVRFPRSWVASSANLVEFRERILSVATSVLHQCSCLEDRPFLAVVEKAFKGGMSGKALSVRPYAELYSAWITREVFEADGRAALDPMRDRVAFDHPSHDELKAPMTPGPGYTTRKSEQHIANRYRRIVKIIRLSLQVLMKDPTFVKQLSKLRAKGYRDWHILLIVANIVTQYRVEATHKMVRDPDALWKAMQLEIDREETPDDPAIPPALFSDERMNFQEKTCLLSVATTWGLRQRPQTPNFAAMEKLLVARYGMLTDDVPHENFFPGI